MTTSDSGVKSLHRVVRQLAPERRVERDRHARREQRVAVGLGLGDEVAADDLAGARLVLDHDLLAELGCPERRDRAERSVDAAACGDGNDQVHGPRRKRLLRSSHDGKCDARTAAAKRVTRASDGMRFRLHKSGSLS